MDPMEFRILNAYRDGDMKAHRREAKNTALVECVQVAAEKAKWPMREEFKRASSRTGGGGQRAAIPHTRLDDGAQAAPRPAPQRTSYDRPISAPSAPPPIAPQPARPAAVQPPIPAPPPSPPPAAPATQHGATRFSSVFGRRR